MTAPRPKLSGSTGTVRSSKRAASSQAVVTMRQGFRNSDGCSWKPPNASQRVAPFTSAPISGTSSSRQKKPAVPSTDSRRAHGMESIDTPSSTGSPRATQNSWRLK